MDEGQGGGGGRKIRQPSTGGRKCQLKTVANFFKSPTVPEATIPLPTRQPIHVVGDIEQKYFEG